MIKQRVDVHHSVLSQVHLVAIVFIFNQRGAIMELGSSSALMKQVSTFSAFTIWVVKLMVFPNVPRLLLVVD